MENKTFSDLSIDAQERIAKDTPEDSIDENEKKMPKQSNIHADEIDKETIDRLRGDAIGDTMYSQSSVIKILLQLSEVDWNEKLEEELCFLWDMTVERDVCEYLFQLSFPSIATAIILKHNEERLIEIIIGILGNICSNSEIVPDITDVEISIVLNAMDTDDHLILLQVMRFITAIVYHRSNKLHFITSDIVDKICFILTNSTNKELLVHTMETLAKITADFKLEKELLNGNIVNSTLTAYNFIIRKEENKDDFNEETDEEIKSLSFFIQIILNLCTYIDEMNDDALYRDISQKKAELVSEFKKITKNYTKETNLIPVTDDIKFYFDSLTIIFPVLNIGYDTHIFTNVLSIINLLINNNEDVVKDVIELSRYIISVSDVNVLIQDCVNRDCDKVLKVISEYGSKCDFNYTDKLSLIVEKLGENH